MLDKPIDEIVYDQQTGKGFTWIELLSFFSHNFLSSSDWSSKWRRSKLESRDCYDESINMFILLGSKMFASNLWSKLCERECEKGNLSVAHDYSYWLMRILL